MYKIAPFLVVYSFALVGCVSSGTHQAVLERLGTTQRENSEMTEELDNTRQELIRTRLVLDAASKEMIDQQINKQDLLIAMRERDSEMERLNTQLTLLKEIELETVQRNEIYAQFVQRLQHMIDGGQLSVKIESGRLVIQLPNNVLFKSGHADVNPNGKKALKTLAEVLAQLAERRFQVEGHTDNRPINSAPYPSNWELSTARAIAVVRLLVMAGVNPQNLSAAGYGEYQPRADNSTEAGRKLNRRIEIIMLPNLEILSDQLPGIQQ